MPAHQWKKNGHSQVKYFGSTLWKTQSCSPAKKIYATQETPVAVYGTRHKWMWPAATHRAHGQDGGTVFARSETLAPQQLPVANGRSQDLDER